MTAEVAVVNKEGIALAADSAVTTRHSGGQKIFASANKIFTLSKYAPVGIMVYGASQFMRVPWETIIKVYRKKLGTREFATVKEHADDFVVFVEQATQTFFPAAQQKEYVEFRLFFYFSGMKREIDRAVKRKIDQKGQVSENEVTVLATSTLQRYRDGWQKAERVANLPDDFDAQVIQKYEASIEEVRRNTFEELAATPGDIKLLKEIAGFVFTRWVQPYSSQSGIVIAGYGSEEFFPSLQTYRLEGIVNDKLKYTHARNYTFTHNDKASILPFAQQEMVNTLMEGIDPVLSDAITVDVTKIINEYPAVIIDSIGELAPERKQELKSQFAEVSKEKLREYEEKFEDYKRTKFVDPVLDVVGMLPKDELASLAESLVNLTSLKRRISLEEETVGGPI